jgi:membrane protein YdbS with pleckstrin-like domain
MAVMEINHEFGPSLQFRKLYFTYLAAVALVLGILPGIAIILFAPFPIPYIFMAIYLPVILFTAYWIPKYYGTMHYKLTEHEMTWRRGVWFKNTGIVPYNRITNIDITQGPVSRKFRIASLRIQTAGYSASNIRSAEITIEGIEKFEELREMIMSYVKGETPVGTVGTYAKEESGIFNELVKIRKLLEKKKK